MTKYLFLLLLITGGATAQNVNQSKTEVTGILCHGWKIDYATIDGVKLPIRAEIEIRFNNDNTYGITVMGKGSNGNWTFNEKEKYIDVEAQKGKTMRIISLTETELTFVEIVPENEIGDTPGGSVFHGMRLD